MDAKEASFYNAVLIAAVILGGIITYFIVSIIRQQRRSVQLYRKSLLTEITTLEKERSRIAADLHDEVGPILSAIKFRINSLDIQDPDGKEELQKVNKYMDSLIGRMREVSFDLMPTSLLRKGLVTAVNQFIDTSYQHHPIKIIFRAEEGIPLSENQSIQFYRIVQEVIHNAIKHAKATCLELELRQEKDMVVLATKDNGIGFNYEARSGESTGLGLRNLVNRTEILGGKMYVESAKDKGTTYIFEVPIVYDTKPDKSSNS